MKDTKKTPATTGKPDDGFSEEERAAMKERAQELKAAKRPRTGKADTETEVLAKISELPEADRAMAERLHEVIKTAAPELTPKTWYGMPAYAKDGKIICFFQGSQKFKTRYSTLGFNDSAHLDDGVMWPSAYALTVLTPAVEDRISELITRAVS